MTGGFLYILSNPTIPGLVKVGKTTRDPSSRAKELSSATGVPAPFLLVYYQPVDDCDAAETWAHAELERRGYRPNADREFFMAPVHEAVEVVNAARAVKNIAGDCSPTLDEHPSSSESGIGLPEELFQLAISYLDGTDSVLANPQRAVKLFEQAAALGHAEAASFAASIYRWGKDTVQANLEKALDYHKQAAARGVWASLALIANIFEEAGQRSAAEKHWILFFENAVDAYEKANASERSEIAGGVGIYGSWYCQSAGQKLIGPVVNPRMLACFQQELNDFHKRKLAAESDAESQAFYRQSLKFLREQLSSCDT